MASAARSGKASYVDAETDLLERALASCIFCRIVKGSYIPMLLMLIVYLRVLIPPGEIPSFKLIETDLS